MRKYPRPDRLEWRNDRRARFDLWRIFNGDVDRAAVVMANYEKQQRTEAKGKPSGNVE